MERGFAWGLEDRHSIARGKRHRIVCHRQGNHGVGEHGEMNVLIAPPPADPDGETLKAVKARLKAQAQTTTGVSKLDQNRSRRAKRLGAGHRRREAEALEKREVARVERALYRALGLIR